MRRLTAGLFVLALTLVAGCGDDDEGSSDRLRAAACADLRDGMSVRQVANSGVRSGLSESRVAALLITAVDQNCPEFQAALDRSGVGDWLD